MLDKRTCMDNNNIGRLIGKIISAPEFSHEMIGQSKLGLLQAKPEQFYQVYLQINRLSGAADIIPIVYSERLIADNPELVREGNFIEVTGQFRSHNKIVEERSRLLLSFFAKEILQRNKEDFEDGLNTNILKLSGFICKPPLFRVTPFNREICDLLIAVNRNYNRSDYIPCLAWGRNARFASTLLVGAKVELEGRIQSRPYEKKLSNGDTQERVAYEVSINSIGTIELSSGERSHIRAANIEELPSAQLDEQQA